MRYSRRRKKRRNRILLFAVLIVGGAAGGWWWFSSPDSESQVQADALASESTEAPPPAETTPAGRSQLAASEEIIKPADPQPGQTPTSTTPDDPTAARTHDETRSGHVAIEAARHNLEAGKIIEARHALNALLARQLERNEAVEVRSLLTRIADDTIFGPRIVPNDPMVETYSVQSGDVLLRIGKRCHVPAEGLMRINAIRDARLIRAEQLLKLPRGPFNAKIYKSDFRLDLHLGDLYVRSYRVGLGSENSTPEGVWKVKDRLKNPTYYPSASNPNKRIIPADDPENPLGERWIGLQGVEGAAVGRVGYGIHGTIAPETIGQAASLGCIRMRNDDIEFLYDLLLPGQSTVTILP